MKEETLRLFVAAPLPGELKTYLAQARQMYNHPAVRQVPEENLHLTLYFIGNVPATEAGLIREKLGQIAKRHQPFTLELEQLEAGPKPRSPRLIWARFTEHQAFSQLSQELTRELSAEPSKQEKFIPHVTLCRFKIDGAIPREWPIVTPSEVIYYSVTSLALWQSKLGSPHPVYSILEEFDLGMLHKK